MALPFGADEATVAIYNTWSEDMLLAFVRRTAKMCGWLVYHTRFSIKSDTGFPDIVLTNGDEVVFAELKRQGRWPTEGRLAKGVHPRWITGQDEWLCALARTGNQSYIWWPSDCHDIATILTQGPHPEMDCVKRMKEYASGPAGEGHLPHGAATTPPVAGRRRDGGAEEGPGVAVARAGGGRSPADEPGADEPPGGGSARPPLTVLGLDRPGGR
jgi:hypothetical protein